MKQHNDDITTKKSKKAIEKRGNGVSNDTNDIDDTNDSAYF